MQAWVSEELSELDLGDSRLNDRCFKVVSALAASPSVSIPTACASWGETCHLYTSPTFDCKTSLKLARDLRRRLNIFEGWSIRQGAIGCAKGLKRSFKGSRWEMSV
jgi:hypothetical protein